MAQLPIDTRSKTEQLIEDRSYSGDLRPYLGISGIADNCARKLWYGFRWVKREEIKARLHRLFQRGHREEEIIQADLRSIGVICHVSPDNQPEVVAGNGHIKGHLDDLLDNLPDAPKTRHLGEYKTHNDKSFKAVKKDGVIKSKPVHYGQMICYMFLKDLTRGLYVAVNKNDDERYYERIEENPDKAQELLRRGFSIISDETPPPRIGKASWFECKWCSYYEICHFGETPLRNCRTCKWADIHDAGEWKCSGYKLLLTTQQQRLGCDKHKFLTSLLEVPK